MKQEDEPGLTRAAVKLSQSSVVAVAMGGGKPGTLNDQGSVVVLRAAGVIRAQWL